MSLVGVEVDVVCTSGFRSVFGGFISLGRGLVPSRATAPR